MGEEWKTYSDPSGLQLDISSMGQVRSVMRKTAKGTTVKPKILKTQTDKCGYIRIRTGINGVKITFKVHRLVAIMFVDLPGKDFFDFQVNHKDGNKQNNSKENLEWCTNQQNIKHAYKTGLLSKKKGFQASRGEYTTFAINSNGEIVAIMNGNISMRDFGFDYRLVSAVVKGKRKSHKGCSFIRIPYAYEKFGDN